MTSNILDSCTMQNLCYFLNNYSVHRKTIKTVMLIAFFFYLNNDNKDCKIDTYQVSDMKLRPYIKHKHNYILS